jgi:hypothetical protein
MELLVGTVAMVMVTETVAKAIIIVAEDVVAGMTFVCGGGGGGGGGAEQGVPNGQTRLGWLCVIDSVPSFS